MIICKKLGESGTCFERDGGCYVYYNENVWVNQDLIEAWIVVVFGLDQHCLSSSNGVFWEGTRVDLCLLTQEAW